MATEHEFPILDGPSKFDLMAALFDEKRVRFNLEYAGLVTVQINRVEAEDGSRDSWNIAGRLFGIVNPTTTDFTGYYSSKQRKGDITMQED